MPRIGLTKETQNYFAIFEIVEPGFERKLAATEYPHSLYIQNIQNTSAASTCLLVKRWLFSVAKEVQLSSENDLLATFFFYQAIEEVNSGQVRAGNKLYELKGLQSVARKVEVSWEFSVIFFI